MGKYERLWNWFSVKNISDLVLKEIYGIYEKKNLTKEEIKDYKMTEREIYEKFDNLKEDELNTKNNKNVYVQNKKSRFVKEQEARGLLSNLGIKTPLSKISLLNLLF